MVREDKVSLRQVPPSPLLTQVVTEETLQVSNLLALVLRALARQAIPAPVKAAILARPPTHLHLADMEAATQLMVSLDLVLNLETRPALEHKAQGHLLRRLSR